MAYDEDLADRIRALVAGVDGVAEKRMFGGLAFLLRGHMAVSASSRGGLLLRCDPADTESLTSEPGVARFEMRGRAMDGWLAVDSSVVEDEDDLRRCVRVGLDYAGSLRDETPGPVG
jgi:TfoX/Sxy family transcriptional regulator of competence genes